MKKILLALCILFCTFSLKAQCTKIMTYNIRLAFKGDGPNFWNNRKDYFCSQLKFYSPDIFGVQEATPGQVSDIANALPEYGHFGTGREGVDKGEATTIYYKTDRFNVLDSSTFWLSDTPEKISKGWDGGYNRVCTYALFKDKKTKKKFWVFNTHLDNSGVEARIKGLQLIESKMKELNKKNYPQILMGDFNSEPSEIQVQDLKKIMNDTRDVSEEKPFGPSGSFNNFEHDKPVTLLIDYIFVSKTDKIKVKKYAILSDSKDLRYPSDHLSVYVEMEIK